MLNFLSRDKLYSRKYGFAYLIDLLIIVLLAFFITATLRSIDAITVEAGAALGFIFSIAAVAYITLHLSRYLIIRSVLKSRQYIPNVSAKQSLFFKSATNDLLDVKDSTDFIQVTENYSLYDVRFDYYRKTKNGQYKSKESFHTVIEFTLRRKLPHLIFDSKTAKGRQYKSVFLKSQKLSLEGNFDEYFDTYSPMFYQIDTLSFITPEVMQAMITLANYDIEVKDDRLLIMAPLLPAKKLNDFVQKTSRFYEELDQNLRAYKDTRIEAGKQEVSTFARTLLINPTRSLLVSVLSTIVFIVVAVLTSMQNFDTELAVRILIVVGVVSASSIGETIKIYLNNRNKIQSYKQLHNKN